MDNSLLLCCEFAHDWRSTVLKCKHQHSPVKLLKKWRLHVRSAGTLKACAQLLNAMQMSSMWVRTEHTVAHLEDAPPTSAPLKTKPSSSLRLAFVLDRGLAFAKL